MDKVKVGDKIWKVCYYDRTVIAITEHNSNTIIMWCSQSGQYGVSELEVLEAQGWGLKDNKTEFTLSEIAEKMGVPVEELRIKE